MERRQAGMVVGCRMDGITPTVATTTDGCSKVAGMTQGIVAVEVVGLNVVELKIVGGRSLADGTAWEVAVAAVDGLNMMDGAVQPTTQGGSQVRRLPRGHTCNDLRGTMDNGAREEGSLVELLLEMVV